MDDEAQHNDEEILGTVTERYPSPFPSLFMPPDREERRVCLSVQFAHSDAYSDAYYNAAKTLSDSTEPGATWFDQRGLPILFLYRHFVELVLKACIVALNAHISLRDRDHGPVIRNTQHRLAPLLDDVRALHAKASPYLSNLAFPSDQSCGFIQELDRVDSSGFVFRYAEAKESHIRSLQADLEFDLDALDAGMLHVYKEWTWYRDLVEISTDLIEDYLADVSDW